MADSLTTKGDYSAVPIQIAPGGTGEVSRPTKGTHLIWGGSDPSSPWAHLQALIAKAGGAVSYFQTSPDIIEANACAPADAPGDAPVTGSDANSSQPEDAPQEESISTVAPKPHPAAAGLNHVSGESGKGALFDKGDLLAYQGEPGRIWAHPRAARSGPRPLIIYLHGINPTGVNHPALSPDVGKSGLGWCHMGKIAHKLIDDGKVTPLAMAAPTNAAAAPWDKIDFEEYVNACETKFKEAGVEIDLDQICIVGHAGAGGYLGRGLNKLADEGAMIGTHKLKLFGIADTRIIADMATAYKTGLSKNDTTVIYALHRYTGGWSTNEYNGAGGSAAFAKALGADTQNKTKVVGDESFDSIEEYWDNGDTKPSRVSIKVKAAMREFTAIWRQAGGYGTLELTSHQNGLPRWTWWALPRFFAQTDADKKLLASPTEKPMAPKPVAPPPPPPATATVTGGDPNLPPAPPIWTPPAIQPSMVNDFEFAPATGLFYPVRFGDGTKPGPDGRQVYFCEAGYTGLYPTQSKRAGHFGARRTDSKTGTKNRQHSGVDTGYDSFGATVVACEAGTIQNIYVFFEGAACVIVQNTNSKTVINYGEVALQSLKDNGFIDSATVKHPKVLKRDLAAGQVIGKILKMKVSAMLHFEMYRSGVTANQRYYLTPSGADEVAQNAATKKVMLNPTRYLMALAEKGR